MDIAVAKLRFLEGLLESEGVSDHLRALGRAIAPHAKRAAIGAGIGAGIAAGRAAWQGRRLRTALKHGARGAAVGGAVGLAATPKNVDRAAKAVGKVRHTLGRIWHGDPPDENYRY